MLLYRFLLSLFATAVLTKGDVAARLGHSVAASGPHVWVHGASNGELHSARPVLEKLIAERSDLNWLITCNTDTARTMVAAWNLPRTSVRLAPVDLFWVAKRMLRDWDVRAHIALESEIWPHRTLACQGPTILLGARMSASTARSWAKLGDLPQRVLERVSFASAQDVDTRDRLVELGLPQTAIGPVADLKALYSPINQAPDSALQATFQRNQTWLAASTHEGDDEVVFDAHVEAIKQDPKLRLILAPRHPKRAPDILKLAQDRGLTVARRSADEPPEAQVYLADTMGEMPMWYQLAGRVFIGGSLSDRGGHTPYEPAAFGAALIHGPDMANFSAARDRLAKANAAKEVSTPQGLADALIALNHGQVEMGQKAQSALRVETDLDGLCKTLLEILPNA
ncbi:glycosyltransferase N-terminal domain-containing protein [uncultured Pelagimonas sp.]|uniref:3-deoxy-D-manno-octulosonic acid transferase n=1 Tax=uncultured Pelagimonas sp. TaxID=1618102 RepID=UPI002620FA51|nr:glycosyltransferase N-terminal domain-containing protein [uncultured Pelagimonas sp.]